MLTIKEIAEKTERKYNSVSMSILRRGIQPVCVKDKVKFYDDSVVEIIGKQKSPMTEEERKEKHRKASLMCMRKKRMKYYKVSVADYGVFFVKACSLSEADAALIADELKAVGINARATPHSFGLNNCKKNRFF